MAAERLIIVPLKAAGDGDRTVLVASPRREHGLRLAM
jgi:hypothetical protein